MSYRVSPASRSGKPFPTGYSTTPTRSRSSTCRRTNCCSGCARARSTCRPRPSARSRISSARATSSRCANWRCAARPTASTTRCWSTATTRRSARSGRRANRWCLRRPGPGAEKLVRSAARLAQQLDVSWHAVYVETPQLQQLPSAAAREHPARACAGAAARRADGHADRPVPGGTDRRLCAQPQPCARGDRPRPALVVAVREIILRAAGCAGSGSRGGPGRPRRQSGRRPVRAVADEGGEGRLPVRRLRMGDRDLRACDRGRHAACALPRPREYRDVVPACGGAGGGAIRARSGRARGLSSTSPRSTSSSCRRVSRSRFPMRNT